MSALKTGGRSGKRSSGQYYIIHLIRKSTYNNGKIKLVCFNIAENDCTVDKAAVLYYAQYLMFEVTLDALFAMRSGERLLHRPLLVMGLTCGWEGVVR